jgi:hypothetical protein
MNSHFIRRSFPAKVRRGGLLAVAMLLGACSSHEPRTTTVIQPPKPPGLPRPPALRIPNPPGVEPPSVGSLVRVEREPPARREELSPTSQPYPDAVWQPGYWAWQNNQYVWINGRWDRPPRPGAVWVAPQWEQRENGYVFIAGHWR